MPDINDLPPELHAMAEEYMHGTAEERAKRAEKAAALEEKMAALEIEFQALMEQAERQH